MKNKKSVEIDIINIFDKCFSAFKYSLKNKTNDKIKPENTVTNFTTLIGSVPRFGKIMRVVKKHVFTVHFCKIHVVRETFTRIPYLMPCQASASKG